MRTFLALFLATIITPSILAATKSKQNLSTVISTSQTIDIAYLNQKQLPPTETLSNLDLFVTNKGLEGAELAISDNNTTGEFTHQKFILHKFNVAPDDSPLESFKQNIFGKFHYVITNLNATNTLAISDLTRNFDTVIFDSGTVDDSLRNENCRGNTLHLLPSRAMKADALAQYMMKKRWSKWFLVIGNTAEDELFAKALKRSAKRFGMKIVTEKKWEHTFDARKNAQSDVSVFTQSDDYDVLVVADEQGLFGEYLAYRTWLSRPIIGTQGLIATAWHSTHDLWGAAQIQHRFKDLAKRNMEEPDYSAYLAVRAIGEAATRTKSADFKTIRDYVKSPQFALSGYKGNSLSFRAWDGQLRQAVLLAAPRSLVAVAPIEGFLHPKTELDTLGFDESESTCHFNK
ncbi:ABC transporter substrate-binding protein [Methylococcaceae bacterium]|nr:ABC transporter substrate-binding protein [Methylococcaceae bacterium]